MTIAQREPNGSATPSPTPSPLRSSPLANPPIYSIHRPNSPSQARPIPRRVSQPTRSRPYIQPVTTNPSSSSSTTTTSTMPIPTPSPPLSRSQPLLGSYPLSLIHSRMSHAHQPHSSSTTFSLHIKAVGQGKRCPAELRCPKPLDLPFPATYYDLEDYGSPASASASPRPGPSQTPWVGTIDLEQYYHDRYASLSTITPIMSGVDPPDHPGYHVAPVGQLQMIVKTPSNALKAFLVPYDLRELPVGGRLLARERTYVHSTSTPLHSPDPDSYSSSPTSIDKGKKKECLRYAYQLQFLCLASPGPGPTSSSTSSDSPIERKHRQSSTTRHASSVPQAEVDKAYYLSKTLKVVFTSTPPEADETLRTERADEIVPPSSTGIRISTPIKQRRRSSGIFGSGSGSGSMSSPSRTLEDWELVRLKWMARRDMTRSVDVDSEAAPTPSAAPAPAPVAAAGADAVEAALPPIKSQPPSRTSTPIPQPFNIPNNGSTQSAAVAFAVKPPPSPMFKRRHLRRTSAEERELSEKLRNMDVE